MRVQLVRVAVLAGYAAFFAALLLPVPLQGALPGNCDSWLLIALSNTYVAELKAWLSGVWLGKAMWPAPAVYLYGESTPGGALLFSVFKTAGLDDVWAFFGFLVSLLSLTAFGVYLLARLYVRELAAIFAGFAFMCSNMMFAHIDDSVLYFYFLPALVFRALILHFESGIRKQLWFAAVLGGLQAYFSVYIFIYQSVVLLLIGGLEARARGPAGWAQFRHLGRPAAVYLALAAPLLIGYAYVNHRLAIETPWENYDTINMTSLNLVDLVLALPGNLLYAGLIKTPLNWGFLRHYNFTGVLLLVSAAAALLAWNRKRGLFAAIWAVALALAVGPYFMWGLDVLAPAPLYPLYAWIPLLKFLRVSSRAYFLASMAMAVLASMSLQRFMDRSGDRILAVAVGLAFFVVHFVENVPFPVKAFAARPYVSMPAALAEATRGRSELLVLDLPSHFSIAWDNWNPAAYDDPARFISRDAVPALKVSERTMFNASYDDLFEYNREIIYMNWQTQHRQNIVGGVNGYFPVPRLIFQRRIQDLPDPEALAWLRRRGVGLIAYHRNMLLQGEADLLPSLEASPLLRQIADDGQTAVFEFLGAP